MLTEIALLPGLFVRKATSDDQPFLENLFFSTRNYLYSMPLPKSQVDLLIRQQFLLQQSSYLSSFPAAEIFIINHQSLAVGKVMVDVSSDTIHVVDIALSENARGKGWGSALLRALKKYAEQEGRLVKLAVDQQNIRAKKLYLALGFRVTESSLTHDTLLW